MFMQDIFQEAARLMKEGQPFALASLVRTQGSTPQKVGAKLLVRQDGSIMGTLGGGCVEADAHADAMAMMRSASPPALKEYTLNEELAWETGLTCGGTEHVFIDAAPWGASYLPIVQAIVEAARGGQQAVLAQVISAPHPSAILGAHLLLRQDGIQLGTLGAPELDQAVADAAAQRLRSSGAGIVQFEPGVEVFLEHFRAPASVLILGGGHVGKAISQVAKLLNFRVIVIDDREAFANKERFPEADEVLCGDIEATLAEYPVHRNTYAIVVTRGHKLDYRALYHAAGSPAGYVGLVGSKRKVLLIYRQLLEDGIPFERLRDIHAPIGLNIGARTPEEIAVSIMAEIVMESLGGDGRPMKLDEKLLHKADKKASRTTSSQSIRC